MSELECDWLLKSTRDGESRHPREGTSETLSGEEKSSRSNSVGLSLCCSSDSTQTIRTVITA